MAGSGKCVPDTQGPYHTRPVQPIVLIGVRDTALLDNGGGFGAFPDGGRRAGRGGKEAYRAVRRILPRDPRLTVRYKGNLPLRHPARYFKAAELTKITSVTRPISWSIGCVVGVL
jgi:hypothetical protein